MAEFVGEQDIVNRPDSVVEGFAMWNRWRGPASPRPVRSGRGRGTKRQDTQPSEDTGAKRTSSRFCIASAFAEHGERMPLVVGVFESRDRRLLSSDEAPRPPSPSVEPVGVEA